VVGRGRKPALLLELENSNVQSVMSTHVTIVACVNAAGEMMSPLLVVKGKTAIGVWFQYKRGTKRDYVGFPGKWVDG
jgi:hypothetical protein